MERRSERVDGASVATLPAQRETYFALVVTTIYLVVACTSNLFHEPWRDEIHAWVIAREATGPLSLLRAMGYEGNPGLWHFLLWPLTRVGGPWLMQALNLVFAVGVVALFVRYAPYSRTVRALFAFGYFPIYEWGTIARSYAAGVFFLFLFAVLYPRRDRHPIYIGVVLALATGTSLHAAIVATAALALLIYERLSPWRHREGVAKPLAFWTGTGLGMAGLLASAVAMKPAPDCINLDYWHARTAVERLGKVGAAFVEGFAPPLYLPPPLADLHLGWIDGIRVALAVAVTITFVVVAGLSLAHRRAAWMFTVLPPAALSMVFFGVAYGGCRHAGFLLVSEILALWVSTSLPERRIRTGLLTRANAGAKQRLMPVWTVTLLVHLVAAAIAVGVDVHYSYSAASATASLIRERGLADLPIVGDADFTTENVIGQLDVPRAYYVNVDRWGSYSVWDDRHSVEFGYSAVASDSLVFERAVEMAHDTAVVVILSREAGPEVVERAHATFVGSQRADIIRDESYWVYLIPQGVSG